MSQPSAELTPLQNAVFLLKRTQAKLEAIHRARHEPIAIIGMGCRFPGGVDSPLSYWKLLTDGVDTISEVPADRWDIDELYDPDPMAPGKMSTRWGGFLDNVSDFDADFFGISPREALRIDPQQRLLLEVAWDALEDAGIPAADISGTKTGVYIGLIQSDYAYLQGAVIKEADVFSATGSTHSIAANRISYVLNLQGPSVALDTACSSSLVTIHQACQSLRLGESDLALAGGANLLLSPHATILLSRAQMMSPEGRCKTFDASADGYVRGEGCGIVVMKRLSDALADGDPITCVIRGTAVNHDGRSNGLSAPSGPAQSRVIRAALEDGELQPQHVNYIEAHGTGTRLGDPIEVETLLSVFCKDRKADSPLALGSVKTNFGHLESAAGIAGLIKTALALKYGQIPPHLNLKQLNPLLPLEGKPVIIPSELRDWPTADQVRRAGVSSFGFGGMNAHIVMEQPPEEKPITNEVERPRHVLTLSARSEEAVKELAGRYAKFFEEVPSVSLADVAYTANVGRTRFNHRLAVSGESVEAVGTQLAAVAGGKRAAGVATGVAKYNEELPVAFLFTGQGAQYAGMSRELYDTQPTFRSALDECAEILGSHLDRSLIELIESDDGTLNQTGYTQPVMFAVEYALAEMWQSWGITPAAVMGHSVGEFPAACVAGLMSLEDGLKLIVERARLMQELPAGGVMAAVFAGQARVLEAIEPYSDEISVAAFNGPEAIVISGPERPLLEVLAGLKQKGVKSQPLATSHAFHSYLLDPMLDALEEVASTVTCSKPEIDVISNLTGDVAEFKTLSDPSYWRRHARNPVQFSGGIAALARRGCRIFLEIGPQPTLIGMGRRCLADDKLTWLPSLRKGRGDWQTLLDSVSKIFVSGADIDFEGFDQDYGRRRVSAPTYAYQRQYYWAAGFGLGYQTSSSSSRSTEPKSAGHPLLGTRLAVSTSERVYESQVTADRPATLADHVVQNHVVVPGAAYLEIALAAAATLDLEPWCVERVSLLEPLVLSDTPKKLQTIIAPEGGTTAKFRVVSVEEDDDPQVDPVFKTHAAGRLSLENESKDGSDKAIDVEEVRASFTGDSYDDAWRAESLRKAGLTPGPTFCWIDEHWIEGNTTLGHLRPACEADQSGTFVLHPGLIDCGFQGLGASIPGAGEGIDAHVPIEVKRMRVYASPEKAAYYVGKLESYERGVATGDVRLYDDDGKLLMEMEGIRLRRAPRDWLVKLIARPQTDWLYELEWVPQEKKENKPSAQETQQAEQPADETVEPSETDGAGAPAAASKVAESPNADDVPAAAESDGSAAPLEEDKVIPPGRWLIFTDQGGLGGRLIRALEEQGQECQVVQSGTFGEDAEAIISEFVSAADADMRGIVCLAGLDVEDDPETGEPALDKAREVGWGAALDAIHGILAAPATARLPKLYLLTRGAQAVGPNPSPIVLGQSPVWGLGRVISSENPMLSCIRIDLDPQAADGDEDELKILLRELHNPDREEQVAYRGGTRYITRLRRYRDGAAQMLDVPMGQPYRMEITSRGGLDNVALRPAERHAPAAGQVEIRVRATGLNFRDVLNLLDLYPGDAGLLGGECAGEVVAVGEGVKGIAPGDAVVALAPGCFSTYATTLAEFVVPKPDNITFAEAATIPITFVTAHYALRKLGGLTKGDRVLIHAASGGVGQAAVQIAQNEGARIYGTAGNPEKREYLRSMGLDLVMNSRELDFADEINEDTNGEGVKMVLNSLTGEAIAKSVGVMAPGGHFLEIGKTDLWDQKRVEEVNPTATFHSIALDQMMVEDAAGVGQLLREVMEQFADGSLVPLPNRVYPIRESIEALRFMARAKHIGKIVIEAAPDEDDSLEREATFDEGASYLITGGLGGLGLKLAQWMVDRGARCLVLTGRSGASEPVQPVLDAMKRDGARIEVRKCDVSDYDSVAELIADIDESMPPLKGIMHLAGLLDDAVLRDLTRERFDTVMAPKVHGSWNLHSLTLDRPLDVFVLFSSLSATIGSPGQGNYASANAFMDALAHHRRAKGMVGMSINWSAWSEVGMAAALAGREEQRWASRGAYPISPVRGMETMQHLMEQDCTQVSVLPVKWPKFFQSIPPGSEPTFLYDLAREVRATAAVEGPPELLIMLKEVTEGEKFDVVIKYISEQAAVVMGVDVSELPDIRRPLNELGFDSLMAVELCNLVGRSIGEQLNPMMLFDYPTLEALAGHLAGDVLGIELPNSLTSGNGKADEEPAKDAVREQALAEVEQLSEEDMRSLVEDHIEKLGQ